MPKQKINLKAALADIRSGSSDAELMETYGLSTKGLEFVFKKLVELNALTASEISGRSSAGSKSDPVSPREAGTHEPQRVEQHEIDPQLAQTAAELVRAGSHDSELMVKLALRPSQLQQLLDDLVRLRYLTAEDLDARKPKKTRRCQSCGALMAEEDAQCRNCSPDPNQPASEVPNDRLDREVPQHASAMDTADEKYCAWEDSKTMKAYIDTASRCLLNPAHFFSTLPLEAGYGAPLLFAVMSVVFGAVFASLWYQILKGGFGALSLFGLIFIAGLTFIGALIVVPLGLLLWSLITHGLLLVFQGAQNGFQATLRVVSYSSVTTVFSAIPVVGPVASLWGLYLSIVGLRETHETDTTKAAGAVLLPVVVPVLIALLVGVGSWFSGSSKKAPLDLCMKIEQFVNRVDLAIAGGKPAVAQEEIKAAVNELDRDLTGLKRIPNVQQVKEKAVRFAVTSLTLLTLSNQLGESPASGQMQEKVSQFRASLLEECRK